MARHRSARQFSVVLGTRFQSLLATVTYLNNSESAKRHALKLFEVFSIDLGIFLHHDNFIPQGNKNGLFYNHLMSF